MVDIDQAGIGESQAVVIAVPGTRSRGTGTAGNDVAAVTLQHRLAGIAGSADGDPVVEQVAVVSGAVALSFDFQLREVGTCC